VIGNTVFLAPEHKVVLTTDAEAARAIGRKTVDFYLNLSQLPEQLEAARFHRRGHRQAGQRQADRRGRRARHAPTTSPSGSTSI
jgi:hypothetical protein